MPDKQAIGNEMSNWVTQSLGGQISGWIMPDQTAPLREFMIAVTGSMIDTYVNAAHGGYQSPELWRSQVQAILFNLGIVLSVNSLPPFSLLSNNPTDPFRINQDVVSKFFDRDSDWIKRFPPTVYAVVFVEKFFGKIKDIICKDADRRRYAKAVGVTGTGSAAALASWVSTEFGVTHPVAIGIATALVLLVLEVSRDTVCDEETGEFVQKLMDDKAKK